MLRSKNNLIIANLILLIFTIAPFVTYAQDNKEQAMQMVEIGDEIMSQTLAVLEAREIYITAVNFDSDNIRANFMAGVTTLQSIDKGAAKTYFLKVLELDPEYSFDILYKIGQAYHYDYQFDEATNYYSRYKQKVAAVESPPNSEFATADEVERKLYECEQGKIMVEFPEEMEIRNVGSLINSPSDDYAPVISQDETLLIFTSRRLAGNLNQDVSTDNYPFEDIFFATRNLGDSVWGAADNIDQPINTLYHDSNVGLSKDGVTLFIYKDDNEGDIFVAEQDGAGSWSEPEPLGKPVNTDNSETTVTLSPDGKTMFFASNRKGGFGGLDIWVTHLNKKGDWDNPENLGEEINTPLDEDGPFIGFDSKTLYFSSEGGEGMGGFDIYRVVYDSLSSSWGPPENMGYPINTPDHDIYFVPTKDGRNAFYSSVRDDGYGGSDIYMLKVPEVLQHEEQEIDPSVTLFIKVYDDLNNLVDVSLKLNHENGSKKLAARQKATGEYSVISGNTESAIYSIAVTKEEYEFQKVILTIPGVGTESSTLDKEIRLVKKVPVVEAPPPPPPVVVVKTTSKKLRNVYFDFNRSIIMSEYEDKIAKAVEYLKSNPSDKLLLIGHSDKIGAEGRNNVLSKQRADKVKKAMVNKGIADSRIQTKGMGAKQPLASNDNESEGRELNRRVEFKVTR